MADKVKAKGRAKRGQKGPNRRLTAKQEMLLEYLLEPDNRHKSVTQVCAELKITRKVYYGAMERPAFQEKYTRMSVALTKHAVAPVVNAAIREAKRGSLGHQQLVLEMAGVIPRGKNGVEVSVPGDGSVKVKVDLL